MQKLPVQYNWQNCICFTGLWDLGESMVMIYSKYALTKVAIATKMNLKCLYTYVDKLLII